MDVTMGMYNDPNGQMYSQLGSMGGQAIGTAFGGPVGGAIGGALGGALGGMLGGKKKKQKQKIFPLGSKENPGWPGFGGGGTIIMPAQGQQPGNQALSGGIQGLFAGAQGSGLGANGGNESSMLGHMFGMGDGMNQPSIGNFSWGQTPTF